MAKFYITTPIYYVNDKPHIGHAYTTIAADVLARFHRMQGDETFFLTGTDEFGSKIAEAAEMRGMEPQVFTDNMSDEFKKTWKALEVQYDDFIRTTSERHKNGARLFLETLKDNGALYKADYEGLYCTGCEAFITKKDLIDGNCPNHKKPPIHIKEKNWFFKLSEWLPKIEEMIERNEIKVAPAHIKKEVIGLFKQEISDFSISREKVSWGIPLPWDESQTIYVWGEALCNYITALGYPDGDRFKQFWPVDLHIMGKDIIKFHCIYWPAMLIAARVPVPRQIFATGFFTVDGQKMSKSIGNVIDPLELEADFGADAVRYLILSQFPFGRDGDIARSKFKEKYNADLANGVGNFISRVSAMVEKYYDGRIPAAPAKEAQTQEPRFLREIEQCLRNADVFTPLQLLAVEIGALNGEVQNEKPWVNFSEDTKEHFSAVFYRWLERMRHIGWGIRPYMMETSDKIFTLLGVPDEGAKRYEDRRRFGLLKHGTRLQTIAPLFPRL
ncbi:MAG: Methionine-tRNA ligase [Parcubacteria group bacterium GW2011_GWA2_44_12]|nr:MAG: Methionine-tRNA ligase [Parcubacteria group bacterium GW2011_GWA2_44_12]